MAIMHPNETVIDNTKSRPSGGGGGGMSVSMQPKFVVEIINQGEPVKVQSQSQRSDGNGGSIMSLVIAAVARDIQQGGPVAESMQGQYGLNRAAGART
jgi:hypothetical protein